MAETSGGGLLHQGSLYKLNYTTFMANAAGIEGPAIRNLGTLPTMTNVTFGSNAYSCAAGLYGYDEKSGSDGKVMCLHV